METEQQQSNRNDAPMVVIWQPDGSLAIGADPARVSHKQRAAADSSNSEHEPTAEETAAAQAAMEEQRAAALQYRQTILRRRQTMFLVLIACDLLFFLGTLIYQGLKHRQLLQDSWSEHADGSALTAQLADSGLYGRRLTWDIGTDDDSSSGSSSQRNLPVSWWLDPNTLRIEDTVFSVAIDLLGMTGAIQLRTTVLTLYCIMQVLSTAALSTVGGISLSLFTMFRLELLLLAFYLRRLVLQSLAVAMPVQQQCFAASAVLQFSIHLTVPAWSSVSLVRRECIQQSLVVIICIPTTATPVIASNKPSGSTFGMYSWQVNKGCFYPYVKQFVRAQPAVVSAVVLSAVLVYGALLEAADLPLAPSAASRLLRSMPNTGIGGVVRRMFGGGRNQERSEGNRGSSPLVQVQDRSAIPVSSGDRRAVLLHGSPAREEPANAAAVPVSAAAALRRSFSSSRHEDMANVAEDGRVSTTLCGTFTTMASSTREKGV